ncbi:MAG TPA: hypothetical protein VL635_01940 [Trinickia sp.]|jgi:hypothetical protein|nr:hypothetical protein [Trinickia sp.]
MKNALVIIFSLIAVMLSEGASASNVDSSNKNHEFEKVQINYRTGDLCSFQFSPVYFCDDRHISEIKKAIAEKRPNFNRHYILISILERKEYYEHTLVAVDAETGIAYPFPFDSYSGYMDEKGNVHDFGHVSYSLDSNQVCVAGSIVAYRETDSGKLCWKFEGGKFVGHRTPYTDE